jgi:hypothetical protein
MDQVLETPALPPVDPNRSPTGAFFKPLAVTCPKHVEEPDGRNSVSRRVL